MYEPGFIQCLLGKTIPVMGSLMDGIRWLSYVLPIAPIGFGTSQWMVMGWSWDGHPTMNGLMAHPIKIHRSSDSEDSVKRATTGSTTGVCWL